MAWWEKLPEWLRWILCWPILMGVGLLTGLFGELLGQLATDRIWIPKIVGELIAPMLGSLLLLPLGFYSIYYFVPRKPHYVIFLWCLLALISVLSSAFMAYVDYINDSIEIWHTIRDLIWASIALIMGIWYFQKFKYI